MIRVKCLRGGEKVCLIEAKKLGRYAARLHSLYGRIFDMKVYKQIFTITSGKRHWKDKTFVLRKGAPTAEI